MRCVSCNIEVNQCFKHAIQKNECPGCGNSLLDEESLALIEDVGNTVRNEAAVREETAHNIAIALVARYNISFRDERVVQASTQKSQITSTQVSKTQPTEQLKISPPSSIQQVEKSNIIKAEEVLSEGVSEKERERIMEEVVKKRYAIMDGVQSNLTHSDDEFNVDESFDKNSLFSEGEVNPILEKDRLLRLAKQKKALSGGGASSFRRSG